jgi:hypothetical protein
LQAIDYFVFYSWKLVHLCQSFLSFSTKKPRVSVLSARFRFNSIRDPNLQRSTPRFTRHFHFPHLPACRKKFREPASAPFLDPHIFYKSLIPPFSPQVL